MPLAPCQGCGWSWRKAEGWRGNKECGPLCSACWLPFPAHPAVATCLKAAVEYCPIQPRWPLRDATPAGGTPLLRTGCSPWHPLLQTQGPQPSNFLSTEVSPSALCTSCKSLGFNNSKLFLLSPQFWGAGAGSCFLQLLLP